MLPSCLQTCLFSGETWRSTTKGIGNRAGSRRPLDRNCQDQRNVRTAYEPDPNNLPFFMIYVTETLSGWS